jgi:hypothetical protein
MAETIGTVGEAHRARAEGNAATDRYAYMSLYYNLYTT